MAAEGTYPRTNKLEHMHTVCARKRFKQRTWYFSKLEPAQDSNSREQALRLHMRADSKQAKLVTEEMAPQAGNKRALHEES